MAVTPILCALSMTSMRRPLSGANTRILPSFHAGGERNQFRNSLQSRRLISFSRYNSIVLVEMGNSTGSCPQVNTDEQIMAEPQLTLRDKNWIFLVVVISVSCLQWFPPLMMLCPSAMKSRELQVMLGTVMRSSSLGLSMCHNLMSSSEQVANNSDVPLAENQKKRERCRIIVKWI